MTTEAKNPRTKAESKKRHEREVEGGAGGAVAGALIGAIGGPPGVAAGAVIGAVAGAFAGAASEDEDASAAAEEEKLDAEIGVSGGELGAPNLKHPPAKVGAYSIGSAGAGGTDDEEEPAEGPMQEPK